MLDIYNMAVQNMDPNDISHWNSDLYLRVNEVSKQLVNEYRFKNLVSTFIDQIDGVLWYDIPFAFLPYYSNHEPK